MNKRNRGFTGAASPDVTARELAHGKLARKAAAEGFVLLKNEGNVLPIRKGSPLGLYGAGAVKTIKGGTGSGDVNERHSVSIREGLQNAGYVLTSGDWLDTYENTYTEARLKWRDGILKAMEEENAHFFMVYSTRPFFIPAGEPIDVEKAKADGADTALFVLSRVAGENKDRTDTEGDYFISPEELALLKSVSASYENVVLIINTGGLIDLAFTEDFPNIKAILQFMQAGQEGGNALADVLSGRLLAADLRRLPERLHLQLQERRPLPRGVPRRHLRGLSLFRYL